MNWENLESTYQIKSASDFKNANNFDDEAFELFTIYYHMKEFYRSCCDVRRALPFLTKKTELQRYKIITKMINNHELDTFNKYIQKFYYFEYRDHDKKNVDIIPIKRVNYNCQRYLLKIISCENEWYKIFQYYLMLKMNEPFNNSDAFDCLRIDKNKQDKLDMTIEFNKWIERFYYEQHF
jgi:hypothetical protein